MLIARVRHKIESDPKSPRFILTVPGLGYKFAARPQTVEDGQSPRVIDLERQRAMLKQTGLGEVKAITALGLVGLPPSETGRRQVTMLSCRLVGSALLGGNLDPEDFASTLRRFKDLCTSVITHRGGAVTSSVCDEILGVFGYPTSDEDDAECAVHAGLDLIAKVGKLRLSSAEPLQVQIAVATGLVIVGEDQHVIGEPVVTAARLRNTAPPNSITITASTRKLLGSVFVYDNLELGEFDGLSEPLTPYLVTAKRAVESRFAAAGPQASPQLGMEH
jgi:class 3 adenylate cyclase